MLVAARDGALVLDRNSRYVTDRSGVLTQELVATQLVTGRIASGSPSLSQQHVVQAGGISLGSPVLSPVGLTQQHQVAASGISLFALSIQSSQIGQRHVLSLESPVLPLLELAASELHEINRLQPGGDILFGPIRFTQLTLDPRQKTPPQRMRSVRADPRGARVMRVRS